jgi:peptidyl-tRNA hydrolase
MTEAEYVLPLVVRIEKAAPPSRTDALEAAATAVLTMLVSENPEWQQAIAAWEDAHIRKVVRRARGAAWARAIELDGLQVALGSAEIAVFPPIPVDAWPPELAKLQVGGTELEDVDSVRPPTPGQPLILLSPHVEMTTGKAMAQVGHAAQLGWWQLSTVQRERWAEADFPLAVRDATAEQWAAGIAAGAPVVTDGGFTEVEPGSRTALILLGGAA